MHVKQVEKALGTLWEAGKHLVRVLSQGMTQPHCQEEIRKRYLVPDQEKGGPSVHIAGLREAEDSGPFRQSKCSPICDTFPTVSGTLRPNNMTATFSEAWSRLFLLVPCPSGIQLGNLHLLGQSQPWMLRERING